MNDLEERFKAHQRRGEYEELLRVLNEWGIRLKKRGIAPMKQGRYINDSATTSFILAWTWSKGMRRNILRGARRILREWIEYPEPPDMTYLEQEDLIGLIATNLVSYQIDGTLLPGPRWPAPGEFDASQYDLFDCYKTKVEFGFEYGQMWMPHLTYSNGSKSRSLCDSEAMKLYLDSTTNGTFLVEQICPECWEVYQRRSTA